MPPFLFLRIIIKATIPTIIPITPTGTQTAMAAIAPVLREVD
jgi:hypothetical protein